MTPATRLALAGALVVTLPALLAAAPSGSAESSQARRISSGDLVRVTADTVTLYARCDESAPARAVLAAGDIVEVQGTLDGWVNVIAKGGSEEGCVRRTALDTSPLPPGQQTRPRGAGATGAGSPRAVRVGLYAHFGRHAFSATRSFDAIFDSSNANAFGGGGQVNVESGPLRGLFFGVDVTRIREEGDRVFVFGGQVFPLGVPLTMTARPIEFTGGYRFPLGGARRGADPSFGIVPYGGGGVGVMLYHEESDFAEAGENVDERFTTYHVLGGAEVPIWGGFGVGVEGHYRWVPDALGPGGVADEFDETDLGGATFRVKVGVVF